MSERFFKGADKNASSKDNLCMLSYKSLQKLATELELPAKIKKDELIEIIRRKREIKSNISEHNTRSRSQKYGRPPTLHYGLPRVYQPNKPKIGQPVATKGINIQRTNECVRIKNIRTETETSTSTNRNRRDKVYTGTVEKKMDEKSKYKRNNANKQDVEQKLRVCDGKYSAKEESFLDPAAKPIATNSKETALSGNQETDNVTSKNNDGDEKSNNTKCSEVEGILAFADFVIHFNKEKKKLCATKEAWPLETPSKSTAVPALDNKMETIENNTFNDNDNPSCFKIITCPAMSCSRIVRLKTLLKHILWVHPEIVSYQADVTTEIVLSQLRECRKKTYFQIINEIMYTTFIECVDDQLYVAIKYIQVANEIKKTAILCIEFPNEESLTWKGRIKGFDQFKMELKDYNIRFNLSDFYGNQLITVRTTIGDDSY